MPPPLCRSAAVVVRASAEESRRAVLGGLLAGVAALTASSAQAMDLIDDRKAKANGFDIIYEARDLDLTQAQRDGLSQVRRAAGRQQGRMWRAPAVEGPRQWKGPGSGRAVEGPRRLEGGLSPLRAVLTSWLTPLGGTAGSLGRARFLPCHAAPHGPWLQRLCRRHLPVLFMSCWHGPAFSFRCAPASRACGLSALMNLPALAPPPPSRLQIRQNLDAAKSRIAESEKRLDVVMESYVSKAYW